MESLKYVILIITIDTKMITILKPGYSRIMRLFYQEKGAKLHLREIARRAGMHVPSASRFLNSLEQDRILRSEKEANLKRFSVRRTPGTHFIFEAFDLERFTRLPSIRRKAIKSYMDRLPETPVFAILFGSTAKDTFKDNSDIDILLVTNNKIPTKEAEKEADALAGISISTFQITYKAFITELKMKEDKVAQSAITTGYPLMNHIEYYEVLHDAGV